MKSAQSSIEYLIMFAFILAVIVPIWVYANNNINTTNERLQKSYAENAVQRLAAAADMVYVQGHPARMTIRIRIPEAVENASIKQHEISIRVSSRGGPSDIYYTTVAPLNGSLPSSPGFYFITLRAMEEGYVNISFGG
ncbi:hypothetical protein DRN74_01305 [Candidatus Micrarchaeota archaeon]|nr:MAG: hypothetical protein DRN74_01305 [Candidatus Micrarchaeota archaeon]